MGQFYVKGVYSHLGLKSALIFSLMLLPFGSALQVSECELCLQLSDFCPSMVNSVFWHDCDEPALPSLIREALACCHTPLSTDQPPIHLDYRGCKSPSLTMGPDLEV